MFTFHLYFSRRKYKDIIPYDLQSNVVSQSSPWVHWIKNACYDSLQSMSTPQRILFLISNYCVPWLKRTFCFCFQTTTRKISAKQAQNKTTRKTSARYILPVPPILRLFSACFKKMHKRGANKIAFFALVLRVFCACICFALVLRLFCASF